MQTIELNVESLVYNSHVGNACYAIHNSTFFTEALKQAVGKMLFYAFSALTTYQQPFLRTSLQTHMPWRDSPPGPASHLNSSVAECPCALTAGHRLLHSGSYLSPASLVERHGSNDNCYVLVKLPAQTILD